MDYSMYISASGAATALYKQDVYTNNLANMTTAGFKADVPVARHRDPVRQEDNLPYLPSNALLERLGAGTHLMPTRVDFTPGTLEMTSDPYDLAIEGNGFFQVRQTTPEGEVTRLSRDGRFVRGRDGTLVTTGGASVLDASGSAITIPDGPAVSIDGAGVIRQGSATIAQIALVDVEDRALLRKGGDGTFALDERELSRLSPASGSMRQYAVEGASVDPIRMITNISEASRAVEANINSITQSDRLNDRLINQFARVS